MAIGLVLAIVASAVILVALNLRDRHHLRLEVDRRPARPRGDRRCT
jgi:hypothetical protein